MAQNRELHLLTMNRRLPSVIAFLFISVFPAFSQSSTSVSIQLRNNRNDAVVSATIQFINRSDSTKQFTATSNPEGMLNVSPIEGAPYLLKISAVNHFPIEKRIMIVEGENKFSFEMELTGKTLDEVVVRAQRPLMRQEDDKTIVEPENLVAASTSGYEVLEKVPGLFVDQDGNIYISSLTPAMVQINGRDMKMSAADVASLLKNLPPNAIARIEIVRTPSAKYDASGGGGVVNVVLKKGVRLGMTGAVNGGFQQGEYGNQFVGFNLNNNDGHRTSYINLNVSRRNSFERILTYRNFAPDSLLTQDAGTHYVSTNYFGGYGTTWNHSKKMEFEYAGSLGYTDFLNRTQNPTTVEKISTQQRISNIGNQISNEGNTLNLRNSFTATWKPDSTDSEWKNDVFHNYTRNVSNQDYATYPGGSPGSFLNAGDGTSENERHYLHYMSDLRLRMKNRFLLEAGLKYGQLWFRSRTLYFRQQSGDREKDVARTNSFDYRENINAAYVQGTKNLGEDFTVKFGTRLENTNMKGHQRVPGDTTFSIHRTDLFPYIYLSKKILTLFGYDFKAWLIYRRTISRPGYEQLNPFPRYVDQFLTESGNPTLRPQFTQNFEANISVDERPIIAVGVNETKDIFTNVIYQSDTSQVYGLRTYDNLGRNTEWYLRGMAAIPPGGVYFAVLVAQYNHNNYRGLYENRPLSFRKGTWTFFTYHQVRIDKRSQFSVFGFLRLRGQQQFYELENFGALNASLNRNFLKQKLTVTLSANDILYSLPIDFTIAQGTVKASGRRVNDSRRFGLNIRYNFGVRKKEEQGPNLDNLPIN